MERSAAPRPSMIPPPLRPPVSSPNLPPDLGPPNGRLPILRPLDMRGPPPLRPPIPFPNFPGGFSNNVQVPPFRPDFPPQRPRVPLTPPAINTTLPKPPIFDKDGEPWLEACSASGKVYYFNARTRETRWSKPESFESAEDKNEVKKSDVEEKSGSIVSDDEMKLSDTETKLFVPEKKVSDSEMRLSDSETKLYEIEDKLNTSDIKPLSDTDMKLSDSEMNLSDTEMKDDDDIFSHDVSDSPPRSPLSIDNLPELKIVQPSSLPTEDLEFMEQQVDGEKEMPTLLIRQEHNSPQDPPHITEQVLNEIKTEVLAEHSMLHSDIHQMPVLLHREMPDQTFLPQQQKTDHQQLLSPHRHEQSLKNDTLAFDEESSSSDEGDVSEDNMIEEKPDMEEDDKKQPENLPVQVAKETVVPITEVPAEQIDDKKEFAVHIDSKEDQETSSELEEQEKQEPEVEKNKDISHQQEPAAVFSKPSVTLLHQPPFPSPLIQTGLPLPFELPPLMRPPPGIPPPGFPGFPPRLPHSVVPSRFPPFPAFRLPILDFIPKTIGDWTEHRLPDGRLYYYNNKSKESKWDKPSEFTKQPKTDAVEKKEDVKSFEKETDVKKKEDEKEEEKEPPKDEKPEDKESSAKKPVASRPIVGTGWHLVWTGDGKVFFFNPTSKTSIWERPKELEDNENVDEILKQGPKGTTLPKPEPEKVEPVVETAIPTEKPEEVEEKVAKVEVVEPYTKKKKLNTKPDDISALPVVTMSDGFQNGLRIAQSDEAMEVEVRKAIIPLDERMIMFTNLLKEKEVSAFSTWEKELHKILFDPRYLLLTMKERKNCFEKYVKTRAIEERKEKIQKLRERKEEFRRLLEEVIYSARITFSDFAGKNSKDHRYKAIEKMKDRESLFNEYMTDFRKHEKEKLKVREERLRKQFFELLQELTELNETSQWKKVKSSIETDRRYELVGSSAKREQFFYEYIEELEEKKNSLLAMPVSPAPPPPLDDLEEPERPPSPDEDPDSSEKRERIEASMRKREEEVRAQKEMYEKDREKERGIHMHEKAVQHFNALLADMVKDTQYSWKETRRSLRKDPRWTAVDFLDKDEKEELFNEHIDDIREKRRKAFRRLLDDTDVPLDAQWRDIRRKIKDNSRYLKFGNSDSREDEFDHYLREKVTAARAEFRELLRETKFITYKSKKMVEENSHHLKDIHAILKKDKRYLIMSSISSEREKLIHIHIDDLHRKGPPPPPTATNPSARHKKD